MLVFSSLSYQSTKPQNISIIDVWNKRKIVKLTCVKILKYRMYKLSPHFFTKIKLLLLVDLNEVQSLKRTLGLTACYNSNMNPIIVVDYEPLKFNLVVKKINLKKNYIRRFIV